MLHSIKKYKIYTKTNSHMYNKLKIIQGKSLVVMNNFIFPQLMIHVRLPLVNREFLMTRVDNEQLIREDPQCRELLLEAMRYHLAPEKRCALATPRTAERKPKGAESYLFAIGESS